MNGPESYRVFLEILAACLVAIACTTAVAAEPRGAPSEAPHTAPWFDPAWPWRQVVRVDQPAYLDRFPTGGTSIEVSDLARPDRADIRVATADGRVMPHVVLAAADGGAPDGAAVDSWVSLRFKLAESRPSAYYVYYGNPDAGPPAGAGLPTAAAGIRLEMHKHPGGKIKSPDGFREAFDASSSSVLGSGTRSQINDSTNPFSKESPRCLALYEGVLRAPAGGDYGLRFKATGLAYLLLDGQPRVTQTRALGQFTANNSIFLEQGDHKIALYVFSRHPTSYIARLQWRPPGQATYETVPARAFPTDVGFSVVALQRFKRPLNAYFTAGVLGQARLVRTDIVLSAVRFRALAASSLGTVKSCTWDFGNGEASTDFNPDHTYREPGTYTATLTARDTLGFEASYSRTITLPAEVRNKMELVFNQQEERKIIRGEAGLDGDPTVSIRLGLKFFAERSADLVIEQHLHWCGHTIALFSKRLDELVATESRTFAWVFSDDERRTFDSPLSLPGVSQSLSATYRVAKTARSRLERELVLEAELPNLPGRFSVSSLVRYGQVEIARKDLRVLLDTDPFPKLAAHDPSLVDADGNHLIVKITDAAELTREPLSRVLADSPRALRVAIVDNSLCPGGPGYDEATLFFGILRHQLEKRFPSRTVTVRRFATERDTLGHFPVKRIIEAGEAIERFRPHVVVISLDQADLTACTPTETIEAYCRLMTNHFAARTRAKIVLMTPPPMPLAAERSKVFALALGRFALERNVELADVYESVTLHDGDWKSLFLDDEVKDDVFMMYMNTTGQHLVADTIFKAMLKE